jgi:uncharacterized protein (DUF4415 family)
MATGIIHGLYATAVHTSRGESIRMIPLRRARDEERRHHEKHPADEPLRMAERGEERTDLTRLKAMSEPELERSIAADPDRRDVPRDWYRGAEAVTPRAKVPVPIRLDADLVEFFRDQGRGWQTKTNAVPRAYAEAVKAG